MGLFDFFKKAKPVVKQESAKPIIPQTEKKHYQEDSYYTDTVYWINFYQAIENPWFVWNGKHMTDCWIYNFQGDEVSGSATAELYVLEDKVLYVNWELELLYEDGWKVKRLGEDVFKESA